MAFRPPSAGLANPTNAWINREGREEREVGNKIGPKRANRFFLPLFVLLNSDDL